MYNAAGTWKRNMSAHNLLTGMQTEELDVARGRRYARLAYMPAVFLRRNK